MQLADQDTNRHVVYLTDRDATMSAPSPKSQNLFQVYLRLRPTQAGGGERFLNVEEPENDDSNPKHITLSPPNDRRRAVEKFAFTRVFEEDATQLDVFHCTGVASLVEGVLAPRGGEGTDALLATLGVTGSGKVGVIFHPYAQLVESWALLTRYLNRHTPCLGRGPSVG